MSIHELQQTLHDRAAAVVDDGLSTRAASSVRRARTTRRRQAIAAVAVAAVVGPLVAAVVLDADPLHRSAPVVHEPRPSPTVAAAFAGRELLHSTVVEDEGEATLTQATEAPTQWTVSCYGVGPEFTVHATLDGGPTGETACEALEPPEPQMRWMLGQAGAGPHTLRAWLTRTGSAQVVSADGSVLATAAYRLPDPVAVVAGVDVYERELAQGVEWEYRGSRQSEPGARRLVASEETDQRLLVELVVTGAPTHDVRLVVDGVEADAAGVLDGSGRLGPLPAGSHTVELRVAGTAAPDARLGVVWRAPVP